MRSINQLILCILFCIQAASGNSLLLEGKRLFQQAKVQHNKTQMLQAHALFERTAVSDPDNWLARYYVALSEYELCIYEMVSDHSDLFAQYIESALDQLNQVTTMKPNWSEAYVLLTNLYGIKIHALQLKGVYDQTPALGMKSMEYAQLAIETDTTNPRAYLTMGIIKLNTPKEYGGSAELAHQYITKAIVLYETKATPDPVFPDWGYLEAYAWLGQILEKLEKPEQALQTYQKALRIEPEFAWIKYDLMPKLNQRLASGK
jgi:tetratricopeptide (TPR) repeat protein